MEWINLYEKQPPLGEYVFICIEGYIGISRLLEDDSWDTGQFNRRPMFNKFERIMSKLNGGFWMPLPEYPK